MIDWGRPYGEIRGMRSIRYLQDGKYFNVEGEPVDVGPKPKTEDNQAPGDQYDEMSWGQLRKLVQDRGGEWINSAEARAWLRAEDERERPDVS